MAVLADGWHMSSHALALGLVGIRVFVRASPRRGIERYAFGTWKVEVLAGYTSAMLLLGIAALMCYQSIERLMSPQPIHYNEAIVHRRGRAGGEPDLCVVAARFARAPDGEHAGTNTTTLPFTAWPFTPWAFTRRAFAPQLSHDGDLNVRSAYVHVLADAATSVLAIIALAGRLAAGGGVARSGHGPGGRRAGRRCGPSACCATRGAYCSTRKWTRRWSVKSAGRSNAATSPRRITDLHVWRVGRGRYAVRPEPDDRNGQGRRILPAGAGGARGTRPRDRGSGSRVAARQRRYGIFTPAKRDRFRPGRVRLRAASTVC